MESESRVNLTKKTNQEKTVQPVEPKIKGQAIPEGVTEVNGFAVQREDTLYIAPKSPFSEEGRRRTW
jgi:hypothetical protein